ncbi:MAG: sialate O-acetylesterase [Planctomycetota bacterium]|jgi:hypothetical protein
MTRKSKARSANQPPKTRLAIYSPRVWQVCQRQTKQKGDVLISGRVGGRSDRVEAKITGKSLAGPLDGTWRPIRLDKKTGAFCQELSVPAGGWYELEVRALLGGVTVASETLKPFGVGEVFITAGQSNSTSCGQFPITQQSGMVSSFNGTAWQRAKDPMWGAHDLIGIDPTELTVYAGGSPWPAFGDALVKVIGVPVGVAVTGHGGSSVNQWQPGHDLFEWMMTRMWQLSPGGFRAVLWHQGESDVEMPPGKYCEQFSRMVEGSRARASWPMPWFAAKASYHSPDIPKFDGLRAEFDAIWEWGIALEGPDTDTLTGDHRDFDGTGIHFSPKGLRAHGRLWAKKVAAWLGEA